jgi:hypothetical protein
MAFDDRLRDEQVQSLHAEIEAYLRDPAADDRRRDVARLARPTAARLIWGTCALAVAALATLVLSQLASTTLPWLTATVAGGAMVAGAAMAGMGLASLLRQSRGSRVALPRAAISFRARARAVATAALLIVATYPAARAIEHRDRHEASPPSMPAQAPGKSMVMGCYAKPASDRLDCTL